MFFVAPPLFRLLANPPVKLASGVVSGSGVFTIDFDLRSWLPFYKAFEVQATIYPSVNDTPIAVRTAADGVTFPQGGGDYSFSAYSARGVLASPTGQTEIRCQPGTTGAWVGNANGSSIRVFCMSAGNAATRWPMVFGMHSFLGSEGTPSHQMSTFSGARRNAETLNGIQIVPYGSDFTGNYALYGYG